MAIHKDAVPFENKLNKSICVYKMCQCKDTVLCKCKFTILFIGIGKC